jgi:replicative DNA helicase
MTGRWCVVDAWSPDPGVAEAEKAVVAAVLDSGGSVLDDLTLRAEDFESPWLANVFEWSVRAHLAGNAVTVPAAVDAFPDRDAELHGLSEYALLRYAVADHAAIVAKHALRRRLKAAAAGLLQRAADGDLDERALADQARALVDDAVGERRTRVRFLRDILPGVIDRISEASAQGGLFVPSPWRSLDLMIGGFRPGCVYVIGARPAQGKTVVAAQIAGELAKHGPVAFSSLEMSEEELVARYISERAGIHVGRVKDGTMSPADWERLAHRKRAIEDLPVVIDDRGGVTAADVRVFARSVSRHGKLAGVIVDYLQLMAPMNARADRHVQVAESSRLLKVMAKDLRVPVVVLSQLNRESENRKDNRPRLAELKESGAIEQDADVVVLLSREKKLAGHTLVMDVAKNRHGETGVVELRWEGVLSRAVEWDEA